MQMNKMKNILLNRRKYQANCTHKILTFIPSCLCKYKCILKNKEMYYEGEERYLKDLDCVSIVKSIRELKALTRILLNQQQRQILEFERASVLPCNKPLDLEEIDFIQNKVPFEYSGSLKQDCYRDSVNKFVEEFSNRELTSIDMKIIDEVNNEVDTSNLNSNIQASLVVIDTQHDTRIRPKLHSNDGSQKLD